MTFDPILADVRFGTGLSPVLPSPRDAGEMLGRLSGPDRAAARFPIQRFSEADPSENDLRLANRAVNVAETQSEREVADTARKALRRTAREMWMRGLVSTVARGAFAEDAFRERLLGFWADHFTVRSRVMVTNHLVTPFVEEAIRPRMTGRFSDLLRAVTFHPLMLIYLDQHRSIGPNSPRGQRSGLGLNENLARETLELHTLGVGAAYAQEDVRQFAELLTGLFWHQNSGFEFRSRWAEPGPETVLGRTYGAQGDGIEAIAAALDDLAVHPATGRHIARKLAVHFVSDDPDPALVDAMAEAFAGSGGALMPVYEVLLDHPAAWAPERRKVRRPLDYLQASLRALAPPPGALTGLTRKEMQSWFVHDMRVMGQSWERPVGPDGWAEEPEAWITPQGLSGRIDWAMQVPHRLVETLPDPRDFVETALGPDVPEEVRFAAGAAENRRVGIGLVLASAAFQRR